MVIIVPSLQHCPVQCFNVLNSFSTRCVFPHLFPDPLQLRGRQLSSESQSLRFTDHLMEEGVRQRTCQGEELPPCPRLVYHTLECLQMGSIVQYALLSRVLTNLFNTCDNALYTKVNVCCSHMISGTILPKSLGAANQAGIARYSTLQLMNTFAEPGH